MLGSINNIYFQTQNINKNSTIKDNQKPSYNKINPPIYFTGKSLPSMYNTVFEYLASNILGSNKKFQVDGSLLSASKITEAINNLFKEHQEKVLGPFKKTIVEKIKWKSYIPEDVRVFSVDKINYAREVRLNNWKNFLQNPSGILESGKPADPELVEKLNSDNSLKLVIWNAITSEIKENNRHIPVPFNEKALLETINRFERFDPKDRAVSCAKPSFLEIYTHRLRDNLLMDLDLSNNQEVWVKVPSIKHEPDNKTKNIEMLEILSCRNWCTRSSVDKAEEALKDGDFYIYLKRNSSHLWEPLVGMTSCEGKIDQIQGVDNNNIVPLNLVGEIKSFIKERHLRCHSGIIDEGPKAYQAILISEKLNELDEVLNKTFIKAIKENDDFAMFKFLGLDVKQLENNKLEIPTYKPSYNMDKNSGISIPYEMFGLNENDLLRNVKVINGNLVLHNKNSLFNSRISQFPPNLEKVTGRVVCSSKQYEKFGEDIRRVVNNQMNKIIIRDN